MTKNIIYIILFVLCICLEKTAKAGGGVNEIVQLKASVDTIPTSTSFSVDIIFGTEQNPIDSLEEFSLSVEFDSAYVLVDTSFFLDITSFLGEGESIIGSSDSVPGGFGLYYKSLTGNRQGFGSIGQIKLVTEDDVPGIGINVPISIKSIIGRTANNSLVLFDGIDDTIYIYKPTGVPQFELNKYFRIYPNPTKNLITINNQKGYTLETIEIIGIDGKTYISSTIDAPSTQLSLENLPNGTYIIKLQTDIGILFDKIVKSN